MVARSSCIIAIHVRTKQANIKRAEEFYSGGYTQSLIDPQEFYFSPKVSNNLGELLFQALKLKHSCFVTNEQINGWYDGSRDVEYNFDWKTYELVDCSRQGPVLNTPRQQALKELEVKLGKDTNTYSTTNDKMLFRYDLGQIEWWER